MRRRSRSARLALCCSCFWCAACGPLRRTPISVGPAGKQGINPPAFTPRVVDANSHLYTPTQQNYVMSAIRIWFRCTLYPMMQFLIKGIFRSLSSSLKTGNLEPLNYGILINDLEAVCWGFYRFSLPYLLAFHFLSPGQWADHSETI